MGAVFITDGRLQRSEVTRERIARATLELIREGDPTPNCEALAARAGIGPRTVFRLFDNMEALLQHICELQAAEIRPQLHRPFVATTWKEQLVELIDRRIRIFEQIIPVKIAIDAYRHRSTAMKMEARKWMREQRAVFAELLPPGQMQNAVFVETLDLIFSIDTWRRLRQDQGLTVARAREVLEGMLMAQLKGR